MNQCGGYSGELERQIPGQQQNEQDDDDDSQWRQAGIPVSPVSPTTTSQRQNQEHQQNDPEHHVTPHASKSTDGTEREVVMVAGEKAALRYLDKSLSRVTVAHERWRQPVILGCRCAIVPIWFASWSGGNCRRGSTWLLAGPIAFVSLGPHPGRRVRI